MSEYRDTLIIGAGLSGLVVANKLRRKFPAHSFALVEKGSTTGGVIRSFADNGFHAEYGPHGFLDNCPESRELLIETGLDKECLKAPLASFVRYVCIGGKLQMIPQSPLKIIKAPLIPWKDKFKVLGDLFKEPLDGEPTVAKWADYRFGKALLPYVDAVFTGTYAGDYNELKIDAVMPGVRALEKQYGSVIRGAFVKARLAKKQSTFRKNLEMPAMTSFPGGMQRLTDKLAESLNQGDNLFLNTEATGMQQTASGWQVTASTASFHCRNIVLALPLNQALPLLGMVDSSLPSSRIPEAWIATVVFGYKNATLPPGFGFLIPEIEKRFTLGTLFSSNMFPNRAPEGHIVFETLVGGRRHPERLELTDEQMISHCLRDIRDLLDLPTPPVYTKVLRPAGGIPQLEKDYPRLLSWRNALVQNHPGLFICGFGWEGIGVNDMIKRAVAIAADVGQESRQDKKEEELKKVYF